MKKYIYLLLVLSLCVVGEEEQVTNAGEPEDLSNEEF